jgi:hypothetical protein
MIGSGLTVALVTERAGVQRVLVVGRSGVQRDLLARRGERPGDLETTLLAEVEAQLAGRTQALRMIGTERRTGHAITHRAELTLLEEATLTRHLRTS